MTRARAIALLFPLALAVTTRATADDRRTPPPGDVLAGWNRVPQAELDALWLDAQATAGVAAIEPDDHGLGDQAARKKVWGFLNVLYRLVEGKEPIWFPVDAVRRTVCGADSSWGYHPIGKERDIHPWLSRDNPFEHLLDARYGSALAQSGVLDLASCEEVQGPNRPCLYGEVTAPKAFDEWFCGGAGGPCSSHLRADPGGAPEGFSRPAQLCFHGPFVLERVHDWRPEIHPAEVIWTRPRSAEPAWRFALVPDDSERFSKPGDYERRTPGAVRLWSHDRAVELWVAFAAEPQQALVFDLAFEELPGGGPHRTFELRVPQGDGPFQALAGPAGMVIAARTWPAPECCGRRGLLVVRADIAASGERARLLALRGRDAAAPASAWPFAAVAREARAAPPVVRPAVRLMPYARVRRDGSNRHTVDVLVRFDPQRPPEVGDENLAEAYDKALAGGAGKRRRTFGTERPLLLDLTLEAHDAECREVPIVREGAAGRPGPAVVVHSVEPGEATAAVDLTLEGQPRAHQAFGAAVTAGRISLEVPPGVTVSGAGHVSYAGPTALPLARPEVDVHFRVPAPSYADEWQLIGGVLDDLDGAAAPDRLRALRADACAPLGPDCTIDQLADEASRRAHEPAGRWPSVKQENDPGRTFARLVRQMAVAFAWDGQVEFEEYARLSRLLSRVYEPGAAPRSGLERRCPAGAPGR